MIRQHDLAQPFTVDIHPLVCGCSACNQAAEEPRFTRSLRNCTLLGLAGIITGQLLGAGLEAIGALALLGIG